jgi:small subunit ribosomal protein S17
VAEKTRRKERVGLVVSNKMQKTVVVAVETFKRHRIYKKLLRKTRRFKVHDESNACSLGDLVRIVETRPLSKEKRWRVAEVLVQGEVAEVAPKEIGTQLIEELMPKAPPAAMPTAPVEEAEAVEEPAAPVEEAEAVQEPEPVAEEVEAVQELEPVTVEAEVVKEAETPVQVVEGEVEGQPAAEAEQEPQTSEEAPEAEEEE